MSEENERNLTELKRQTLVETLGLFFSTYTHHNYPSVKETKCRLRKNTGAL
jgi:hypothetical protein